MKSEVFLDTAYAIALSSLSDHFHQRAFHLAREIKAAGVQLVTTRAVMLEIGNALSSQVPPPEVEACDVNRSKRIV